MSRFTIPPAVQGLLVLLWILFFAGLGILSWWMGPVDPPIPP